MSPMNTEHRHHPNDSVNEQIEVLQALETALSRHTLGTKDWRGPAQKHVGDSWVRMKFTGDNPLVTGV